MDLFGSEKNHKLPVFFSARPFLTLSWENALTQNRERLYGYAFLPINLIARVLRIMRLQPTARVLLVAPFWPSQPWFRQLNEHASRPTPGKSSEELSHREDIPQTGHDEAVRMALSANPSLTEDFQQGLLRRQLAPGENQGGE